MTQAMIQMIRLKGIDAALLPLDQKRQCTPASWEFVPLSISWRCIARIFITGQRRAAACIGVDMCSASGPSLAELNNELR